MKRYVRPYLDALAWIDAFEGNERGVNDIQPILAATDSGRLTLVVSAIMPVELLGGGAEQRQRADEERALAALQRPNVLEVPVNRAVVMLARELRLGHGLKSMDALHLASAVRGRADVFLTRDSKALAVSSVQDTTISEPYWYGDIPLPGLDDARSEG